MQQISQLRAQINAPVASTPTFIPATYSGLRPRLSEEEIDKLKKFDRCFNCKEVRHLARGCARPNKPYLAVNSQLQEIKLVEDTELEKK